MALAFCKGVHHRVRELQAHSPMFAALVPSDAPPERTGRQAVRNRLPRSSASIAGHTIEETEHGQENDEAVDHRSVGITASILHLRQKLTNCGFRMILWD
jgi:hypothetical protein